MATFFSFFFFIFYFFRESFNLWRPLLIIALYHQTKTPINFLCKQELNIISLIQPSKTLLIKKLIDSMIHKSNTRVILRYSWSIKNCTPSSHIHSEVHNECERKEHHFSVLQKYLRIFPNTIYGRC